MKRSCGPFYLLVLIFLAGLLVLDVVSLTKYYTRPEQIRSFLEQKLGNTFDLENSHYNLLHGLQLENVRLHNEGNQEHPFLKARRVQIDLSLTDLLQGRTIPSEIQLHKPDLTLFQKPNGELNIRTFLEGLPAPDTEGPMDLKTGISISEGSIKIKDVPDLLSDNEELRLTEFDLDIRPIRNGSGFMFDGDGSGTLQDVSVRGRFHNGLLSAQARARSIDVQKELVQMFSPEIQDVWGKYNVIGPATVNYEIDYEVETANFPPETHSLTIHPEGMSGAFIDFPYPLENISGTMAFEPDGLTLELRSTMDDAEFSINGHTEGYGERSELHLVIDSQNVPINDNLYTALDPEPDVKEIIKSLNVSGSVDATGSVNRQEGAEDIDFSIRIYPQGISASYDEFPYPVQNLNGTVVVEPDRVRIEQVTGTPAPSKQTPGSASVTLNGLVQFSDPSDLEEQSGSFDLHIDASEIPLEETLKKNLPDPVQQVWNDLEPEGTGSAKYHISDSPAMSSPRHRIDATLKNCTFQPLDVDQPVEDVRAQFSYENNRVTVQNASGKWNAGTIQIDQGKIGTSSSRTPFAQFDISGKNLEINSSLKKLIFEEENDLGNAIQNQGTMDLNGSVRWFLQQDEELEYFLSLNVDGMSFEKILDFNGVQGRIVLKGEQKTESDADQTVLTGGLDLSGMNLNGVPVDSFQSNFILRKNRLKVHELNARLLDGTLKSGHLLLNMNAEKFDVDVNVAGLDLQKLLTSAGVEEKNLSGTLLGTASLNGTFSDRSTWTGKGELQLRDAQLWKLPLFLPIFMELSLSKQEPFTEGALDLDVKDKTVFVRDMTFESPSSRLTGQGHVDFSGTLLIYLQTKQLESWIPTIPVVSWIYRQITSNLVTFKATGTLSNPTVSATPLPFIFK